MSLTENAVKVVVRLDPVLGSTNVTTGAAVSTMIVFPGVMFVGMVKLERRFAFEEMSRITPATDETESADDESPACTV